MDKKVLIEKAKQVFAFHKQAKILIATTDGQFFLEGSRNMAIDHAHKTGSQIVEIKKDETIETERPVKEVEIEKETTSKKIDIKKGSTPKNK